MTDPDDLRDQVTFWTFGGLWETHPRQRARSRADHSAGTRSEALCHVSSTPCTASMVVDVRGCGDPWCRRVAGGGRAAATSLLRC